MTHSATPHRDRSTPRRRHAPRHSYPSELTLFRRHGVGDLRAREELVRRYLPLAHRLAWRYHRSSEPTEDLQQVAALALVKALDRYQPQIGPFVNYAATMIKGELSRHFRDRGWTIRVGRSLQEHLRLVQQATDELAVSLGHSPTAREIAGVTGLTLEQVLEALEASNAYRPLALDAPNAADPQAGGIASSLADSVGREDARYELVELADAIGETARELPERERAVLYLRFVEDLTQKEIGERIGVSQMQVSRLLRRSLDCLRTAGGRSSDD